MMKETANVTSLYSIEYCDYSGGILKKEILPFYYADIDDAKKAAINRCVEWKNDPYRYLITTDGHDIRIYDKDEDTVRACVFIKKHRFVELG